MQIQVGVFQQLMAHSKSAHVNQAGKVSTVNRVSSMYFQLNLNLEATIIPEFNGKAYIRLAGPTGMEALRKRKMDMEIIFLRKPDEGNIVTLIFSLCTFIQV